MNSKTVGELTEAKVLVKLLSMGYVCSKPFGDNARYDLIADDGETLYRVQIKTGRVREGCVMFNTSSSSRYVNKDYRGQIDWFVVYVPETDKFYVIPEQEAPQRKMQLSLIPTRLQKSKEASRFEI